MLICHIRSRVTSFQVHPHQLHSICKVYNVFYKYFNKIYVFLIIIRFPIILLFDSWRGEPQEKSDLYYQKFPTREASVVLPVFSSWR